MNILWILSDLEAYSYIYQMIIDIAQDNENLLFFIIIENSLIEKKSEFIFSKFFKTIDFRLYSFKKSPFRKINIKENNLKNIKIIEKIDDFINFDWVVFTNEKSKNESFYFEKVKIGMLQMSSCNNMLINNVLEKKEQDITFKIKLKNELLWKNVSNMTICLEKGIVNSIEKYYWSLKTSIVKFFRNQNVYIYVEEKEISKSSKLKLILYYIKLFFFIVKRKLSNEILNWRILFRVGDKLIYLEQPINTFWADPFLIKDKNQLYLFIEEMNFETNLGEISCIKLNEKFEILEKKTVIKENSHYSFPNIFCYENEYYMIPENVSSNRLDLYKATQFPFQWEFEKTMINCCKLVDAVWIYYNEKYWLFGNKIEEYEYDNNDFLYLYYSDDLLNGYWHPHKQNPIVSNSKIARNGGKVFEKEGKLYRVSQDCSETYGAKVVINEILELSTENYKEIKTEEFMPPQGAKGLHTYNFIEDIEVFDFLIKEKNNK